MLLSAVGFGMQGTLSRVAYEDGMGPLAFLTWQLAVEGGRSPAVGGRQRRELEAEPAPQTANGIDHLGRDLATDRGDSEIAIEDFEPVVTRGH